MWRGDRDVLLADCDYFNQHPTGLQSHMAGTSHNTLADT